MEQWFVMAMFYAWLGFTLGYFFHKWMERNLFQREGAESAKITQSEWTKQEPQ